MSKNVIIGQSGGPTAVINSSLAGVYKAACSLGADKVYEYQCGWIWRDAADSDRRDFKRTGGSHPVIR